MYPVFPLVALNASVAFNGITTLLHRNIVPIRLGSIVVAAFRLMTFLSFASLSILRIWSMYEFYHAPLDVYPHLFTVPPPGQVHNWTAIKQDYHSNAAAFMKREVIVCVEKEWYRFPSHFFVPDGFRVGFLKHEFGGLLPKYFPMDQKDKEHSLELLRTDFGRYPIATKSAQRNWHVPVETNDQNMERMDQYVHESQCDYLVDTIEQDRVRDGWTRHKCVKFLDAAHTPQLSRLLYFGKKKWLDYCLFIRSN